MNLQPHGNRAIDIITARSRKITKSILSWKVRHGQTHQPLIDVLYPQPASQSQTFFAKVEQKQSHTPPRIARRRTK